MAPFCLILVSGGALRWSVLKFQRKECLFGNKQWMRMSAPCLLPPSGWITTHSYCVTSKTHILFSFLCHLPSTAAIADLCFCCTLLPTFASSGSHMMGCVTQYMHTGLTLVNSPQSTSSLPSAQSVELSHLQEWGTHWPSPHQNSDGLHVCTSGRNEPHNSRDSSLPSLQSARPSHSWILDRHLSDGPQEKAVQLWQDVSSLPSPHWSLPSQRKCREMHRPVWQANSSFPHNGWPAM